MVALNVADVAAAATVTDAGTVRVALVFVSVTACCHGRRLVQRHRATARATRPKFVGLQASAVTTVGATRLIVTCWELLPNVAVTVAD